MEFDWSSPTSQLAGSLTQQEVEESFEDPFAVKLLPDSPRFTAQARFFSLGRTVSGKGVFAMYRTNGRQIRVIMARPFEPEESFFYERKVSQALG
ncbi:MAG: BrnT family toxin [Verrucomicrobiales bacterium]|nr:BrnT family toxin [Verrucomicrobiales bacterium]